MSTNEIFNQMLSGDFSLYMNFFGSSQILVQYHIIAARSVFFNKVLFKKLAVVPENSKFIVTKKTKAYNGNNR